MVKVLVKHLLELDFVDKASWPRGEWDNEPDKVYWIDNETGLPCLIIRGPVGSLNGYVGVPIYHPAYGLSYDGETQRDHDEYFKAWREQVRNRDRSKPILDAVDYNKLPPKPIVPNIGEKLRNVCVHGGLTFSKASEIITKESWEKSKLQIDYHKRKASKYTKGESAKWLKDWMPIINDYEAWSDKIRSQCVCLPDSDEPDEIWWFGFDCAHACDLSPMLRALLPSELGYGLNPNEKYRNISYVENECQSLAKQLKALDDRSSSKGTL